MLILISVFRVLNLLLKCTVLLFLYVIVLFWSSLKLLCSLILVSVLNLFSLGSLGMVKLKKHGFGLMVCLCCILLMLWTVVKVVYGLWLLLLIVAILGLLRTLVLQRLWLFNGVTFLKRKGVFVVKGFIHFPQHPVRLLKTPPPTIRGAKMPNLINIDWIQFTAHKTMAFEDCPTFLYTYKLNESLRNKQFAKVYDVYHVEDMDNPFAQFCTDAHVSFIDKKVMICKVMNRFLYHKNLRHYVDVLLSEFQLKFMHFGRVDFCMDFQQFPLYDCTPEAFLKQVAKEELIKNCQRNLKPIKGPPVMLEQDNVFWFGRKVKGISFGSRSSMLYTTMYNKSLEMRQCKQKPYIIETWEHSGFDMDKDTFRIEFSLKPTSKNTLVDYDTGEAISHKSLDFISVENMNKVFTSLFQKKFCFAKYEPNVRFSRLEPVKLFEFDDLKTAFLDVSDKQDSSNHTKAFVNFIYKRIANFSYQDTQELSHLEYYLSELLYRYHLSSWFRRKYPKYLLKEYLPQLGQLSITFPENNN